MDSKKLKALSELITNAKNLENDYQTLVKSFHTHAEMCKSEEFVYREEDVLILIKLFWENGFDKGLKFANNSNI